MVCPKEGKTTRMGGFSLSKKQYSIFMLRAAARIQSNLLCKFINSGSMYLGIYTREEKMCPQDAVFLRDSLESVVSSERLFGKRSFSTASTTRLGGFHCGLKFRDWSLKLCISGIACVAVAVGLVHGDQIAVIIKGTGIGRECAAFDSRAGGLRFAVHRVHGEHF